MPPISGNAKPKRLTAAEAYGIAAKAALDVEAAAETAAESVLTKVLAEVERLAALPYGDGTPCTRAVGVPFEQVVGYGGDPPADAVRRAVRRKLLDLGYAVEDQPVTSTARPLFTVSWGHAAPAKELGCTTGIHRQI